jgi:hypothetical protein
MWLNNTGVSEDRRNAIDVMYRAIRLFEDLGPKMRVLSPTKDGCI